MLRFTIRDILWLTVVVALGVGWWVQVGNLMRRQLEETKSKDEQIKLAIGEAAKCREHFEYMRAYVRKELDNMRERSKQIEFAHNANMKKLMQEKQLLKLENFSLRSRLDALDNDNGNVPIPTPADAK